MFTISGAVHHSTWRCNNLILLSLKSYTIAYSELQWGQKDARDKMLQLLHMLPLYFSRFNWARVAQCKQKTHHACWSCAFLLFSCQNGCKCVELFAWCWFFFFKHLLRNIVCKHIEYKEQKTDTLKSPLS